MRSPDHPVTVTDSEMPGQPPVSGRVLADYFSRAFSEFRQSGAKLSIVCSSSPAAHRQNGLPTPIPPRIRPRTLIVLDSSFNPPTRAHLRMAVSSIRHLVNKNKNRNGQLQPLDTLRLLLLLSINNADKAPKPAAFDQRLAMMWAFARDLQRQLQSDSDAEGVEGGQEEEQGGLTADLGLSTLPYFHEKSAAIAESDFYYGHAAGDGDGDGDGGMDQLMLVGYDTLIRIFNPKYYHSSSTDDGPATTPMQQALDPLFARARLRMVMRADDEWGSATEQRAYLADLLEADGLSRVGGRKEWASRIEIEMVEGGRGAGAQDVAVSSTYARAAARDGDSQRLDKMVSPSVRQWIEQEGLYTE